MNSKKFTERAAARPSATASGRPGAGPDDPDKTPAGCAFEEAAIYAFLLWLASPALAKNIGRIITDGRSRTPDEIADALGMPRPIFKTNVAAIAEMLAAGGLIEIGAGNPINREKLN